MAAFFTARIGFMIAGATVAVLRAAAAASWSRTSDRAGGSVARNAPAKNCPPLGVLLATRARWPWGSLLGAHMALNLAGWFGTAIVGTLHTFFPSLTQTHLRFARTSSPRCAAARPSRRYPPG
jgi:hypothetical protein